MMTVKSEKVVQRKGDDTKRGISVQVEKVDYINLKTLLLVSGETLSDALTRMIKNFIEKKGKIE
jgi:hypothetical protein